VFRPKDLEGVLVALASPLRHEGDVDEVGVGRLIEHVIAADVNGVLALGSTGETASLDEVARRRLLTAVIESVAGRVPVLCGVAQPQLSAATAEIAAASSLGADAVLVAPPFYYPTDQHGVLAFYRRLAEQSTLPILLYNIPQFTKVVASPSSVATLAREGAIQGIKDSSRDFEYFEEVCIQTRDQPEFRIFTGSDTMLVASLAAGGAGTICGAGNVAPAWVVRIFDAYTHGRHDEAREAQDALFRLVMALRGGVFPSAIKAALHMQGICEPWLAPPGGRLDEQLSARLREQLAGWDLLTPAPSRN